MHSLLSSNACFLPTHCQILFSHGLDAQKFGSPRSFGLGECHVYKPFGSDVIIRAGKNLHVRVKITLSP